MLPQFFDSVLSLVVKTSTDLPPDVRAAMKTAMAEEPPATQSGQALAIIAENIDLAEECEGAICQDTGMPTFEVKTPVGANQIEMRKQILDAVAEATRRGKLRPNSVDSITGENTGTNLGHGTPIIHFEQWARDEIEVKLILKGGGCENMNAQYSLPTELPNLGRADRTLDGVRKCILHAVWNAQGKGCAPGAVGVCIGGDRTSGYVHAKEQLFRTLDDVNPDSRLAELEASIMGEVNKLGIGAMGFGGRVSLIGCKVGALNRLPASFFVSVAYDCWAYRRLGVVLDGGTGADNLRGGAGRDTASYANAAAGVTVSLAAGTGTVGEAAGDVLTEIENVTGSSFLALGYLIVFGSILAFSAYMFLLRRAPASRVGTHAYVNPLIAVALGVVAGNEPITASIVMASVVIVGCGDACQ